MKKDEDEREKGKASHLRVCDMRIKSTECAYSRLVSNLNMQLCSA